MKRYRILTFDFDSRATGLEPPEEYWEEKIKHQYMESQQQTIAHLKLEYGEISFDAKLENFKAIGAKPFSISAFHNKFLEQARNSFVVGGYYPALTGVCSLGERILNHMMLLLRDYHRDSQEYKKIFRKQSFDHWPTAIDALEAWGELLPEAAKKFRELNEQRNRAIHFNPETDHNERELALEAIHTIQNIVKIQFSAFGTQPWYFCVPGEIYIKKEWENMPLIKHVFIPNALLLGPKHRIESVIPKWVINDEFDYENKEITDEEYIQLRKSR